MPEPIMWAHRAQRTQLAKAWNRETNQLEVVIDDVTGQPRRARVPQRAHESGDPDNPRIARHLPYLYVLRNDGHVVRAPLSMGAADVEGLEDYGREMRKKYVALGWIPVGMCPIARVAGGLLRDYQVVDKQLRDEIRAGTARACTGQHGPERQCPHYLQELDARLAANKRRNDAEAANYRTESERLLEQQLAAQQSQTTEIVKGVASALAEAVKVAAQPAEPTTTRRSREP
jgi:hypothetical protein